MKTLSILILSLLLFIGCSTPQGQEPSSAPQGEVIITGKIKNRDFYPQVNELVLHLPFFKEGQTSYTTPIADDNSFYFNFTLHAEMCEEASSLTWSTCMCNRERFEKVLDKYEMHVPGIEHILTDDWQDDVNIQKMCTQLNVHSFPYFFIINREGVIVNYGSMIRPSYPGTAACIDQWIDNLFS